MRFQLSTPSKMVADMDEAPPQVKAIFDSFVRLTRDELWESEEELRTYVYAEDNYKKLLKGEIGINLIQTHTAMSMAAMDDWVDYVFRTVNLILGTRGATERRALPEILTDIRAFCAGRVHNLWGSDRNEGCPSVFLNYDIPSWLRSPLAEPSPNTNSMAL